MNYATGCALNTKDILCNFPNKKLKMTAKECENIIGNRHKELIAELVFKASIDLILNDIIENNVTFILPTKGKHAELGMKTVDGEEFIKCRQNGKFLDINFITSNFTGYQMNFKFQSGSVERNKNVYLNKKYKDRISELVNQGKIYF